MRKKIDIANSPRRSQYTFFRGFAWPFLDVSAQVDVTELLAQRPTVNGQKVGVFTTCMHAIMCAVNAVPEFRQRIEGEDVFEYETCSPSFTTMGTEDVFNYAVANFDWDLATFAARVQHAAESVKDRADLNLDEDHRADLIFVTCLPWLDFTSIHHPRPMRPAPNPADDSVPRIAWGKIVEKDGRKMMSVAVSAHHALIDGVHLARFYEAVNSRISSN